MSRWSAGRHDGYGQFGANPFCSDRQMLALLVRRNEMVTSDIASAIFTVTKDINAEFPALAARQLGWLEVPCAVRLRNRSPELAAHVVVRVLVHWNTTRPQSAINHVYIHDAVRLRPDLSKLPPVDWNELENWITSQMGKN